ELLGRAVAAVPSEAAALLLLDESGRQLVFQASRTLRPGVVDGLRLPTRRGIAGWVARERKSLKLDDVASDPRHEPAIGLQASLVARTMICVPMVSKDRLRGVIQVINKVGGDAFDDDELRLTERLAEHAAIAIENASLYRQAYLASITDDLTGLGNTRRFHQVLAEATAAGGGEVALVVLDLDHFKEVVDPYGHLVGSRTIADFGRRIGKRLRPGDFAARFGGDEFVVLLPATGAEEARAIADSIRAEIEACDRLEGEDVDLSAVTASVGVAVHPTHGADSSELFRAADAAMYRAKRGGRNRVHVAGD
ncbi:MAG: diguanylate cyclase, partial [Candidatus Binatia bacterium]